MSDRTYYAIVPRGTDEPEGLFYKQETADELDLVGLNRTSGAWESMPNLLEFFLGDGSGDRAATVTPLQALKIARKFGVKLPAGEAHLATEGTEEFHLESHNEKDHGRRGVNKVTKKGSTTPFVPTVKKKGSTTTFTPTVKKTTPAPKPADPLPLPPPAPDPVRDVVTPTPPAPQRTVTPPAEKASVDPVTTDLASKTPTEIDTELFPLWADRWTVAVKRHAYVERLEKHQAAKDGTYVPKSRFEVNPILADYEIKSHAEKIAQYDAELDEINAKIAPFEDEFKRRGGWERFDFVPDGHLHKRGCHTLYPTTERLCLAEASGKSDEWIVGNFAYAACTVCFPSAPVEARDQYLSDRKKANQAEREAKKAAKAAKEAEKNLVKPVKVPGSWRGTITSVYDAKSALKSDIEDDVFRTEERYWTDPVALAERVAQRKESIRILSEALDLKGFDVDSMIAKWRKQAEKEKAKY